MKSSSIVLLGLVAFICLGFALPVVFDRGGGARNIEWNSSSNIVLYVTSDYGQKILGNASFDPDLGLTAMEMLQNITQIETRYGGLFVNGAYGLRSDVSKRLDWFYYVNGAYMDRGLASYMPRGGEVVQVDYHHWGNYAASPGFLTGYPQRFLVGLGGERWNITIASSKEYLEVAHDFAGSLSDVCKCEVRVVDPDETELGDVERNLILLVGPEGNSLYSEVMSIRRNAFWPVKLLDGRFTVNHLGSGEEELEDGYALESTDLPGGRWALLVMATDDIRMGEAIERLGYFESLGPYAAVMVNSGQSTALPVQ